MTRQIGDRVKRAKGANQKTMPCSREPWEWKQGWDGSYLKHQTGWENHWGVEIISNLIWGQSTDLNEQERIWKKQHSQIYIDMREISLFSSIWRSWTWVQRESSSAQLTNSAGLWNNNKKNKKLKNAAVKRHMYRTPLDNQTSENTYSKAEIQSEKKDERSSSVST